MTFMSNQSAQIRKEEARRLAMGYLAERQSLSFQTGAIHRGVNREHGGDYTEAEIEDALNFLAGTVPPLIAETKRKLAASKAWQATSEGVLAHERSEL
jgi:hypothetical protein